MTQKLFGFTVEGSGEFPFAMLRFDQCWPVNAADVNAIMHRVEDDGARRRNIVLNSIKTPNGARWESFGWKVLRSMPI